jgi:hypothetical protein
LGDLGHRRWPRVQPGKDAQPAGGGQRLDALGGCARETRVVEQSVDVGMFATVSHSTMMIAERMLSYTLILMTNCCPDHGIYPPGPTHACARELPDGQNQFMDEARA